MIFPLLVVLTFLTNVQAQKTDLAPWFTLATLVYKDVDETRNVDRYFQSFKFTPK